MVYSKYVVHGVRESNGNCQKVSKGQRPHFYTIYGIDRDGHEIAVLDSKKKDYVVSMAAEWNGLIAKANGEGTYADVRWTPRDVKTIRPRWSLARCEEELGSIERHAAGRICELGWEVLNDLLPLM